MQSDTIAVDPANDCPELGVELAVALDDAFAGTYQVRKPLDGLVGGTKIITAQCGHFLGAGIAGSKQDRY